MEKLGFRLQDSLFTSMDGLERTSDIENLFGVLSKFKDHQGNFACFTALCLLANPDFEKIENNGFRSYFYEPIKKTYLNYGEAELLSLWKKQGIPSNLMYPQFHGREHLNYSRWLKQVKQNGTQERVGFDHKSVLGIRSSGKLPENNFMAAFEGVSEGEQKDINSAIIDGLDLFKSTFGFASKSAMPSQSIITEESKKVLKAEGVDYLQCGQHFKPDQNGLKKVDLWWGHTDTYGLRYWRRNCSFEPYKGETTDHINDCLNEIKIAFQMSKPAVISTHRINFTSRVDPLLRDKSLKLLEKLLKEIQKKWPDALFINSAQLGNIIDESSN